MANPQDPSRSMEDEEDKDQEMDREKFKRERDQEKKSEDETETSKQEGSDSPHSERKRDDDEKRERDRSRERRGYRSDSPTRDRYRDRNRDLSRSSSPSEKRSRDSPPVKRRRREDDWEDRDRSPRGASERDRYSSNDRYRRRRDDYDSRSRGRPGKGRSNGLYEGSLKNMQQFLEYQDEPMSRSESEQKYQEYKEEFKKKHFRSFFEEHKNDEWFKEKYDPLYLERSRTDKLMTAQRNLQIFTEELESGTLDYQLNSDGLESESTKETETIETEAKTSESTVMEPEVSKEESNSANNPQETTEQTQVPLEGQRIEESTETVQAAGKSTPIESNTLFIKSVPPTIGKAEIRELFKGISGFTSLTLSEPLKNKNFHRLGWATFDTKESCSKALEELRGSKIKDFELQMAINKPSSTEMHKKPKVAPPVASEESRILIDCVQCEKLCHQLDKEKEIVKNPLFSEQSQSIPSVEQLDKTVTYLRKIHFFCYYCGEEFDSEDELIKKCGKKHFRGKKVEGVSIDVAADPWANNLDVKINFRLDHPDNPDLYTGKLEIEKKLDKFFKLNIISKEKSRFRCSICSKLFAGDNFVKKHINLKHPESVQEVKNKALEIQFFENYFNDPKKIVPPQQQGLIPLPPQMRQGSSRRSFGHMPSGLMEGYPSSSYSTPPSGQGYRRGPKRGRPRSYPQGSPPLEPPPGMALDPRASIARDYVDLDAPTDEVVQIDYRTSIHYGDK